MFCSKCGKEIDDQAMFCVHCGQSVGNANSAGGQSAWQPAVQRPTVPAPAAQKSAAQKPKKDKKRAPQPAASAGSDQASSLNWMIWINLVLGFVMTGLTFAKWMRLDFSGIGRFASQMGYDLESLTQCDLITLLKLLSGELGQLGGSVVTMAVIVAVACVILCAAGAILTLIGMILLFCKKNRTASKLFAADSYVMIAAVGIFWIAVLVANARIASSLKEMLGFFGEFAELAGEMLPSQFIFVMWGPMVILGLAILDRILLIFQKYPKPGTALADSKPFQADDILEDEPRPFVPSEHSYQPTVPAQPQYGQGVTPGQVNYGQGVTPVQQGYGQGAAPGQQGYGQGTAPGQANYGQGTAASQSNYGQPGTPDQPSPVYGYGETMDLNALQNRNQPAGILLMQCPARPTEFFGCDLRSRVVLGRDVTTCNIVVSNENSVSRNHCCFYKKGQQCFVEDLGSSNHTLLNGKLVTEPTIIRTGDKLRCGNLELIVTECNMNKG